MPYPTKYTRQYDFNSYQNSNPTRPLPGSQINIDLDSLKGSVGEIVDFLKGIARSDGKLANGSVGINQLDSTFKLGFSLPTVWEPGVDYTIESTVLYANKFWHSREEHRSTGEFDESKWDEIVDFGAQANAAAASAAAALASQNVSTDNATATAADRVQTGSDASATAADRVQTGQDVVATAANRVQTGSDASATSADRAAAEFAKAGAEAAATNNLNTFGSFASAEALGVPEYVLRIQVNSNSQGITLGAAHWRRREDEPSHPGKQYIAGSWWELDEPILNQYMFGAVGDGVVDDTLALQNMLDYGKAFSSFSFPGPQIIGAKGQHRITSTLRIMSGCDLSAMVILCDASALSRAIRVGSNSTSAADLLYQKAFIRLPVVINTKKIDPTTFGLITTGWAGFSNSIGIEIANIKDAEIHNAHVAGFGTNLWLSAYSQGNVSNEIHIGQLGNGQRNLMIMPADETGWVNENILYGGRYYHESSEGANVTDVNHILLKRLSNISNIINNNLFIKPSIEGDTPQHHVRMRGQYNRIVQGRYESSAPKVYFEAVVAGETLYNHIDGGYNAENIAFSQDALALGNMLTCARLNKVAGNPAAFMVKSEGGDSSNSPHLLGFDVTTNLLQTPPSSTSWKYNLYSNGFDGKQTSDAYPRVQLDFSGVIRLGPGSAALSKSIRNYGSVLAVEASWFPYNDNAYDLGGSANRFKQIWAMTTTISTSDAREKERRGPLEAAELRVASRLSELIGVYRWRDAITAKGDGARLHIGVLAQDVQSAFTAEGLDGFRYGVLCYDAWDAQEAILDEAGNELEHARKAGDRYGIRYDELWAFIAAGFEARLAALEGI